MEAAATEGSTQAQESINPISSRPQRIRHAQKQAPGTVSWTEAIERLKKTDSTLYTGILEDARAEESRAPFIQHQTVADDFTKPSAADRHALLEAGLDHAAIYRDQVPKTTFLPSSIPDSQSSALTSLSSPCDGGANKTSTPLNARNLQQNSLNDNQASQCTFSETNGTKIDKLDITASTTWKETSNIYDPYQSSEAGSIATTSDGSLHSVGEPLRVIIPRSREPFTEEDDSKLKALKSAGAGWAEIMKVCRLSHVHMECMLTQSQQSFPNRKESTIKKYWAKVRHDAPSIRLSKLTGIEIVPQRRYQTSLGAETAAAYSSRCFRNRP
jgi:hypothetical protein